MPPDLTAVIKMRLNQDVVNRLQRSLRNTRQCFRAPNARSSSICTPNDFTHFTCFIALQSIVRLGDKI